jgi:UDP-N-acetylmuramate--alanine ligase
MSGGKKLCQVELSVPGEYNVKNALAAAAAALTMGINPDAIARGLKEYRGAERRFEFKGEYNGARIYDDYAHHPSEIHSLLDMAKTLGYERVICAFQPHTYSRTKALFPDFVTALSKADKTILADVYAARETDTLGISSRDLAERIPGGEYCPALEDVFERLKELAQPGDLILTVGAGNLNQVAAHLAEEGRASSQND